jgi:hypothetical protein
LLSQRVSSDYDDQNHLVGYAQVNRDAQGNESEVLWSGVNGGRGLVVDFEEQTTDAQGNRTVKRQKGVEYDAAGRAAVFVQEEISPLDVKTVTHRTGTAYNGAGLVGRDRRTN